MAADPEMQRFLNRLKILRDLTIEELQDAGWSPVGGEGAKFYTSSENFFIRADDPTQAAIWQAIKAREVR